MLTGAADDQRVFCHSQGKLRLGPGIETRSLISARMPHTDAIVVMTTLASDEDAVKLVQTLLERGCRLWHRGAGRALALPLAGKDRRRAGGSRAAQDPVGAARDAELAFEELHPYKVPELLALPVTAGTTSTWSGSTARRR